MSEQSSEPFAYRTLFAVVYTTSISAVYFALGVVARHAGGLTPFIFLVGGIFFAVTAMTYAEGVSLHRERGGSATLARYAFNELVSFVAGWAIVLDYTILLAVTALVLPAYLGAFSSSLGHGAPQILIALAVIALVSLDSLTGSSTRWLGRRLVVVSLDLLVQAALIVLGLVLVFHPHLLADSIHLGTAPTFADLAFALPIATIAFTGLEAGANVSGEVGETAPAIRRLILPGSALIVAIYVGIALVGVGSLPVHGGRTALGQRHLQAPLLELISAFHQHWLRDVLRWSVAISAALGLFAAARAAMLGVSRVGYSLATNRQIPSAVGRLHSRFGTPVVVIGVAAGCAAALILPANLEFLVGIYAFGALLAFTIAHLSVISLRFREADRERGYSVPLSLPLRGKRVPLPAVAGAVASAAGWLAVLVYHHEARYVGAGWLAGGLLLYVVYRKTQSKPLLRRVTIPDRALRHERTEPEFGSILVPIVGEPLDDDIIQTAARLAGESRDDVEEEGAMIEAIWIFEMPLSLPLDAPLPDSQVRRAREALSRAKQVGEEYEGVQVATAIVRARRAGQAIVNEARRRGVELIVMAAEEPSRVRGGALFGGRRGPLDNYVGEATKYVVSKAPCRVILTAPPGEAVPDPVPAAGVAQTAGEPGPPAAESAPRPHS